MKDTSKKSVLNAPKSNYNPNFVKVVKQAQKSKKRYVVTNIDDFWGSI